MINIKPKIYIWVFLSIQQAGRTLRQGKSRCFNYTFSCYSIYMLFVNLSSNFFKIQMNYMIWKAIYIIQCNVVDNQIIFLSFVHLNKYIRCLIIISDIRYTPVTCLYWCYSNCKSILMLTSITIGCRKNGYFGDTCTLRCLPNCQERRCDIHTGHCLGCLPGYQGPSCNKGIIFSSHINSLNIIIQYLNVKIPLSN